MAATHNPVSAADAPGAPDAKARLLAATVDYVIDHGVADLSLRRLADAIGTSHRMLIYHFGSKDGLVLEVVQAVEARQRQVMADLGGGLDAGLDGGLHDGLDAGPAGPRPGLAADPAELVRRLWAGLADPGMWPLERLFFELYGRALQGDPAVAPFLDDIVESWLGPAAALGERLGLAPEVARDEARLGLAVTRGLLLDLLATGDRVGVDRALERYLGGLAVVPDRPVG